MKPFLQYVCMALVITGAEFAWCGALTEHYLWYVWGLVGVLGGVGGVLYFE